MKEKNAEVMSRVEERTSECSTSSKLYKPVFKQFCDGKDSDAGIVLAHNNSEVDQLPVTEVRDLRVPVLNMRGEPLMPTTPRKARELLEEGKAKVVSRDPFVIQLLYPTGENKQKIVLGIDAGYKHIGYSEVTSERELIRGTLELRNNIKKLLEKRRASRRLKRNKLWYRKPRFLNRSIPKGWLAPSIKHKFESHLRLIEKLKRILPITSIIVEVANFDQQKMQNPEISGVEYQQGALQGYNVRNYLLEKWNRKCAYCSKKDVPLEIEHIIPKMRDGSNRVSNLTLSCHECNQKKGNMTAEEFGFPNLQKKAQKSLTTTAFMNIVRWKIVNTLNCGWTYGHITKYHRIRLGLEKRHDNDAFVIAGGEKQERCKAQILTQTRRNNRSLQKNRKGFKPSIRRRRYKFQPHDLVKSNGILYRVKGVFSYGTQIRLVDRAGEIVNKNIKKVELVKYGKGIQ